MQRCIVSDVSACVTIGLVTNNSVPQSNARPRVPLGTPHDIELLKLVLKSHKLEVRYGAAATVYLCSCSPQATRREVEYYEHVSKIVCQRLEDHLDREATVAEVEADRAAGLLCDVYSVVGSQCSRAKGHHGQHTSVWGRSWDDKSDRTTAEYIAKQVDGRRD